MRSVASPGPPIGAVSVLRDQHVAPRSQNIYQFPSALPDQGFFISPNNGLQLLNGDSLSDLVLELLIFLQNCVQNFISKNDKSDPIKLHLAKMTNEGRLQ